MGAHVPGLGAPGAGEDADAMANTTRSVLASVIGIVVCGLVGGVGAWSIVDSLGLAGVGAAVAGAVLGMVVATAAWLAMTVVLRRFRLIP